MLFFFFKSCDLVFKLCINTCKAHTMSLNSIKLMILLLIDNQFFTLKMFLITGFSFEKSCQMSGPLAAL